jgi:hypothetical protein
MNILRSERGKASGDILGSWLNAGYSAITELRRFSPFIRSVINGTRVLSAAFGYFDVGHEASL